MSASSAEAETRLIAQGIDDEPVASNERSLTGWQKHVLFWACAAFTAFHLLSLNVYPLETWTYRILHVAGALCIGFALVAAMRVDMDAPLKRMDMVQGAALLVAAAGMLWALGCLVIAYWYRHQLGQMFPPPWVFQNFGIPLVVSTSVAIVSSWVFRSGGRSINWFDWVLIGGAIAVASYLLFHLDIWRFRAGVMALPPDLWAAVAGTLLIIELTRRSAGMALVAISVIFILYSFVGPWLPGFLHHAGYSAGRFFTYIYTDNGILGAPVAVSSTYIILFIAFAAFLQASKVGDYFVNFAFAVAGRTRGGPAKVAVFASGLMGMINGTSAGNVVATGSLTIPLMKRVGYRPQTAGAIEATASTGGQIMPPIMGAGAFIMAEITGIPYTDLIVAAIIPACLYFLSVFIMVDLEALKLGLRGMREDELPEFRKLVRQAFLFLPVLILIGALFFGYSVIRAGTLALMSAMVVSWLTPYRMGPRAIIRALELAARMSIQIIAVCACAGIIVGVIALTGVGARFSSLLLGVAAHSQLLALIFAMFISIMLGMGMPTTAAYAVAASVVAPGLQQLGIPPLIAHFFVFYYAVVSAITPPVALAAYAGAAISGAEPMRTAVTAFKIGLAAFIVPFIFFYSPAMLLEPSPDVTMFGMAIPGWLRIVQVAFTASIGVCLLASAVQGYFFGRVNMLFRAVLLAGAMFMITGGGVSDLAGIGIGVALFLFQRMFGRRQVPVPAE
ncbi:MAG: TRAP transporter permease [Rhodospirillales bacterium]|nr:MAG: TRAP transporter permease [Rhodospirillales bacterium]